VFPYGEGAVNALLLSNSAAISISSWIERGEWLHLQKIALFGASTRRAIGQNRAALLSTLDQFSVSGLEISLLDGALLAEHAIKGRSSWPSREAKNRHSAIASGARRACACGQCSIWKCVPSPRTNIGSGRGGRATDPMFSSCDNGFRRLGGTTLRF
jgi:hypothetical protein